ncbi:DUF2989 domain-containing protein [Oceanimonas smirnovii]|uniref:DUF2989 domain-containing protein n=1 Tax=Oceanimonas smirnovii TaxID=264574 RepID=UPI00376F65DC
MRTKTLFFLFAGMILLTGCERDPIENLCSRFPKLCTGLNTDGWCKEEKRALIEARYENAEHPGDASRYRVMSALDNYQRCLEPLLDMQYTKRHERKNTKVETIIDIDAELARLEASTASSDYPYLQLWRWERHGDRAARRDFIAGANRPEMQQAPLQKALAGFLLHQDPTAAERALQRALALTPTGSKPDADLLASLTGLYISQRRYRQAWLWSRVISELYDDSMVDWKQMEPYARFDAQERETMTQQALILAEQLREGQYQTD